MKIYVRDVDKLSNEEYALIRKDTFGASDVSTLFDLGFKTLDEMIEVKANPELTEEEKAIGELPSVRKGKELEPFIIQKFIDKTGLKVTKPTNMYEIFPGLTVNFDAVYDEKIPVEIKYVTTFGHKNYKTDGLEYYGKVPSKQVSDMKSHIKYMADQLGIPPYYYTQLQTQIYGLDADYGYLVALFEKDWTLRTYKCPADPFFRKALPIVHHKAYNKLCEIKGIKIKEESIENFTY